MTKHPKARKCDFVLFLELVDTFDHLPRISAAASLLLQGFFLYSMLQMLAQKDCHLEVRTSAKLLQMDPFFPEFLCGAMCPGRM